MVHDGVHIFQPLLIANQLNCMDWTSILDGIGSSEDKQGTARGADAGGREALHGMLELMLLPDD